MSRSVVVGSAGRLLLLHLHLLLLLLPLLGPLRAPGNSQSFPAASGPQGAPAEVRRELSFRRGRRPGSATPAATLLQRAYRQKAALQRTAREAYAGSSVASSSSEQESSWTPLGPAPLLSNASGSSGEQDYGAVSGRVTTVAVDPNDRSGNTVYIGGANGGVWKSSNAAVGDPAAVAWTPLTDRESTLSTGAIAVHPRDPRIILVGTGEANLALDSYYGLGILRTSDGGGHWALIPAADNNHTAFAGLGFSKIAFSTANPGLVAAGTSNFNFYPGSGASGQGLYYSRDAGVSWYSASVKDGSIATAQRSVTDVAYNAAKGKFFAAMAWHGIYSSTDGVNWSRLANQPGGSVLSTTACPASGASTCPILRAEIAIHPTKDEVYVWYIAGDPETGVFVDQGIWKSTDDGTTWTAISESGINNCGDFDGCGAAAQGWYSLELTAVPDGSSATDLYAGATNIYKCRISSSNPDCGSQPFLNLTHVYGCVPSGSLAHVHPRQHAIGYAVADTGKAVMYFGNDGGVYRVLDGYELISGSCGETPNSFASLNGTLGSLTALVSLSQHATEAGTLLAGAQGNGSAATDVSHSGDNGTSWIAVNRGEGGYTAINPANSSQWFTTDAGVTIQSCNQGINCRAQDFQVVVSSMSLGGDAGAFITPYLLDPQASNRMLAGTCRVWRGNNDGSGFSALSYNFETGSDSACSGAEDNLISFLATGGTPLGAGGSPVIYAGTAAGRIFVTTNAAGGSQTWYEATPPETGYPISSLVLDTADSTGRTAFASVMGFGVPHVWKTSDAGLSWTDVTGNLPDAPADSLLIDPDDHQLLYAGTDVGVFSAEIKTGSNVNWEQVGPASAGRLLPNVPVTKLGMFKAGSLKLLRAATYGRGAWELVLSSPGPDYTLSLANPVLMLFPGQEGNFTGELTALYGYNSPVVVSCEGALPEACAGETATPTRGGTEYTVSAHHGSVQDFSFNILATGTDGNATTHRAAASLRVVDFALDFAPGVTPPVSLTANSGSSTEPVGLVVQAQGSFQGTINLSCGGLPAGATCGFYPSAAISFSGAGASAVTLTIATSSTTPNVSAVPITISAATTGAPAAKTQTVLLTVKNEPDYQVQFTPASLNLHPGDTVTVEVALTAVNNYRGTVAVSCGATTLVGAECNLSANVVYLTNVSTNDVTMTLKVPPTASAGAYTVSVDSHDLSGAPAHVSFLPLKVLPDFVINLPQATATVNQGGTATYTLQVSSLGGAFAAPVTFACTGLPKNSSYFFTPGVVVPGSGVSTVTLNVVTSTVAAAIPWRRGGAPWAAMLLPTIGVFLVSGKGGRKRILLGIAWAALCGLALLAACGGGNGGAAPPIVPPPDTATPVGTYTLTVTATSGAVSHSIDLTLIVQ